MRKLIVAVLSACAGMSAFAAYSIWRGPDGGRWNDPDNWEQGLPNAGVNAAFPVTAEPLHVEIDGDCFMSSSDLTAAGSGYTADNPSAPLIFTGTGKLTVSAAVQATSGREIIIDGPTVNAPCVFAQGGRLVLRSGEINASEVLRANGAARSIFVLEGGHAHTKSFQQAYNNNTYLLKFVQTGGLFTTGEGTFTDNNGGFNLAQSGVTPEAQNGLFRQTGGRICGSGHFQLTDRVGTSPNRYHSTSNLIFEFGGELYMTNGAGSRAFLLGDNLKITGGGKLYMPEFWLCQPECATAARHDKLTLDVGGIYLGTLMQNATGNYQDIHFPRKTTFGAFAKDYPNKRVTGDWSYSSGNDKLTFYFEKGLVIDTTDCFDHETGHKIYLGHAVISEGAELDVLGNGEASLVKANGSKASFSKVTLDGNVTFNAPSEFATESLTVRGNPTLAGAGNMTLGCLDVGAGATYNISGYIRTETLSVGAGGTVNITAAANGANRLELDDEGGSTIDEAANFTVTIPSTLAAGRYIVFFTANTDSAIARRFTIVGEAHGFELEVVGGCVIATSHPATTTDATWQGTVDGQVSNRANWKNGVIPYDKSGSSAIVVTLGQTENMVLSNDYNTVFGTTWKVVRFNSQVSLPFVLTGEKIAVSGGAYVHPNAMFYNSGSAPFYVDADVNQKAEFSAVGAGQGYVYFGKTADLTDILDVIGDVRVGGTVRAKNVVMRDGKIDDTNTDGSSVSHSRRSELTVCRGGVVTVSNQEWTQYAGTFRVNEGARLTVSNGVWEWSTRTKKYSDDFVVVPPTNRIDGTLELGAAFGGTLPISFSGKGTIRLFNAALSTASETPVTILGANTLEIGESATLQGVWSVAKGAALTVDAKSNTLTVTHPFSGEGTVDFASGTRLALGGDLAAAIDAAGRSWTKVACVPDGADVPQVQGAYQVRINDGVLEIRNQFGALLIVR